MRKRKKEIVYNAKRNRFTNKFKRRVLLEFASGKSPNESLSVFGYNIKGLIANDKKYSSKLIHKWRQELYKNVNFLLNAYEYMDTPSFKYEIDALGSDTSEDKIHDDALEAISNFDYKKYLEMLNFSE